MNITTKKGKKVFKCNWH